MHLGDSEILDKLVQEIAFASKNPGSRAEKTAPEYAASLLDFVRQCTASQVCVRKRVIGFWGANHSPTFGTVQSISNDGLVRIVWDGDINFSGHYERTSSRIGLKPIPTGRGFIFTKIRRRLISPPSRRRAW